MKQSVSGSSAVERFVSAVDFPCVGAKSALSRHQITSRVYPNIQSRECDLPLLEDLYEFIGSYRAQNSMFQSFIAEFEARIALTEEGFETAMWQRLQAVHDLDRFAWDTRVNSDPENSGFSLSIGGEAFFIIGMHPNASRRSRRYIRPALVFNLHDQFERLRHDGRYERMRDVIRERDQVYSGSPNPVVRNFGDRSEARQYSGRNVPENWRCPFHTGGMKS